MRNETHTTVKRSRDGIVTKVIGRGVDPGRETWRVVCDGKFVTITTKPSSAAAMDEAMVIYARALRQLADR